MDHVVEMTMQHRVVFSALVLYQWQKCVIVLHQIKSLVWTLCVPLNRYTILNKCALLITCVCLISSFVCGCFVLVIIMPMTNY